MTVSADELTRHAASLRSLARDLLADEALAEDVVQEAFVAALTRPPTRAGALGAWVRAAGRGFAIDRWRSERRRRQREHAAASAEGHEPADAAAQLELQEDIVAAVRALDEPYRTVVWLRHFEQLPPATIAAQLAVPLKTVKTRLWRALQLLRQKLDHRHGGRGAWLALLPNLMPETATAPALVGTLATSGALMQGKSLGIAGVLAALIVFGTVWSWPREAPPIEATTSPGVLATAAASAEQPPAPTPPPGRVEVPAAAPTLFGALRVQVRWHDGAPAAGIAIHAVFAGEPQLDRNEQRLLADASGIARADRVWPGDVRLSSDRGGALTTTVEGGEARDVEFVLPDGVDVAGVVHDERHQSLAGAEVVLVSPRGGWLGGRSVATSDDHGAFTVRDVPPTWSIGARAKGYAPSALVDLEDVARENTAPSVSIELQLRAAGATVVGKVVDENGAPIAGATVVLGRGFSGHPEATSVREAWSPHVVESTADGTFRCDGVEPGEQPIAARAEGCSRATATVTCVAGSTATPTIVLARAVTVRGIVRDEAGDPVADAIVTTTDDDIAEAPLAFKVDFDPAAVKRPRTRSDATGAFELRGSPPGTLRLLAAKRTGSFEFAGTCEAILAGRAGDELVWNPVLIAGKTLRIRFVAADGKPMQFGLLDAHAEEPARAACFLQTSFRGMGRERETGKPPQFNAYDFTNCADVPYTVTARLVSPNGIMRRLYWRHLRPGGPEIELRLPPEPPPAATGEITGRFVDQGNRAAGRRVRVSLCTPGTRQDTTQDGDRFTVKDVPPGTWFVWVQAGGDPIHVTAPFELQPGQKLDLGDIVTEPDTSLRVALRTDNGATVMKPRAVLGEGYTRQVLRWDGSQFVGEHVPVGRHRLTLETPGWHAKPRDVELTAGMEQFVTLEVVPATKRRFNLTMPWPEDWQRCEFAVRDQDGALLASNITTSEGVGVAPHHWHPMLPFGRFTLEAVLDGERRTWPLDLRDGPATDAVMRLSLR